jgi:hypothetical protein
VWAACPTTATLADVLLLSVPVFIMRPNRMVGVDEPQLDLNNIEPDEVAPLDIWDSTLCDESADVSHSYAELPGDRRNVDELRKAKLRRLSTGTLIHRHHLAPRSSLSY